MYTMDASATIQKLYDVTENPEKWFEFNIKLKIMKISDIWKRDHEWLIFRFFVTHGGVAQN